MNELSLANANIKKLSLGNSIIKSSLDCKKTKIEEADRRETFTTLKENCMKKYDNVSALYFYKREMTQYKSELTWKDDFTDKSILFFEKIVSNYGTDPFLPMCWILLIQSIDYCIRTVSYTHLTLPTTPYV